MDIQEHNKEFFKKENIRNLSLFKKEVNSLKQSIVFAETIYARMGNISILGGLMVGGGLSLAVAGSIGWPVLAAPVFGMSFMVKRKLKTWELTKQANELSSAIDEVATKFEITPDQLPKELKLDRKNEEMVKNFNEWSKKNKLATTKVKNLNVAQLEILNNIFKNFGDYLTEVSDKVKNNDFTRIDYRYK